MTRLETGMLIKTNYSGPYRIRSITRNCTCPDYVDIINNLDKAKPRPSHIHLACSLPDRPQVQFYLNGFNEQTLKSIGKYYNETDELEQDSIIIMEQDQPIQKSLFD